MTRSRYSGDLNLIGHSRDLEHRLCVLTGFLRSYPVGMQAHREDYSYLDDNLRRQF